MDTKGSATRSAAGDDGGEGVVSSSDGAANHAAGTVALPANRCPSIDDGSLETRFRDEPKVAAALLGVDRLDPLSPIGSRDCPETSSKLSTMIDRAICSGQVPITLGTSLNATSNGLDLAGTIELLVAVRQRRNALETAEALLLEQARREGFREEASFIDPVRINKYGDQNQRAELVQRAIVADASLALHDGHDAISQRLDQGEALIARAPRTLENAIAGRVHWKNAAYLADQVAELAPSIAAQVDAAVAERACTASPAVFRKRLRTVVERVHPTPMEVRHQNAACKRYVRTDPAADGMGYLTLFAPVTAITAIWDRLSRTAKQVRHGTVAPQTGGQINDSRTLDQLRTDTAIALLLDDGTLDLAAATSPGAFVPTALAERTGLAPESSAVAYSTVAPSPPTVTPAEFPSVAQTVEYDLADATEPYAFEPDAFAPLDIEPPVCRAETGDTPFSLARIARSIRPKVFVTVPVLTLIGAVDSPAMLDGDIPIDAETARELAGLSTSFTRILTDPVRGQVLAVDAKNYRPPADLRQWVQLRDATCRFPGCIRRAVEADIDHQVEWSKGGQTGSTNLTALCRRHHSLKTIGAFTTEPPQRFTGPPNSVPIPLEGASTYTGCADAPVTWVSPTGQRYTSPAEPVPATIHPPGARLPKGPTPEQEFDFDDDYSDVPY